MSARCEKAPSGPPPGIMKTWFLLRFVHDQALLGFILWGDLSLWEPHGSLGTTFLRGVSG